MSRRANQSGSVYQRSDGRWVASVSIGGKRITRYARTKRDAERSLQGLLRDHHLGRLTQPSRITLTEWAEQWLASAQLTCRPSTLLAYGKGLALYRAHLGHVRIDRLTPALLASVTVDLQRKGIGPRRLQLAHCYLKSCLQAAVDLELLAVNPMTKVPKPKWQPRERQYWSSEEASRFIDMALADSNRWGSLFVVLSTCGLRISEALGLRWGDIDLRAGTLRVDRALVWTVDHYDLGPVKTKSARRTVSLPEVVVLALQRLPRPLDSEQAVFVTEENRAPRPDQLRTPLDHLCKAAGVARPHIHGLRHVAAMLALQATGDIHLVQKRLGHSTPLITMALYAYSPRKDADAAEAIGRLLDGAHVTRAGAEQLR